MRSTPNRKNSRIQTAFLGDLQTRLTSGGEVVAAERRGVALHGVEARRHEHHVWGELAGDGHDHGSAKGRRRRHWVS